MSRITQNSPTQYRIYIDEAGRWPLAWPVTVGLCIPLRNFSKESFKDSKTLTEKKREQAYTEILQREKNQDLVFASGRASNNEIDRYGIIPSLQLAVMRGIFVLLQKYFSLQWGEKLLNSDHGEDIIAWTQITKLIQKSPYRRKPGGKTARQVVSALLHITNTSTQFTHLIIDGNHDFWLEQNLHIPVITIIKGDSKQSLISLSSIIAKVERDRWMKKLGTHKYFQVYWFEQHKGYGTKKHRQAIVKYWLSQLHRESFCRNIELRRKKKELKKKSRDIRKRTIKNIPKIYNKKSIQTPLSYKRGVWGELTKNNTKPSLLLHICCAPDLTRPLQRLKEHFRLYLFRYNPNIHPRAEYDKRYAQFMKLTWLEPGDYEILEDRYDPKEFFDAMIEKKESIASELKNANKTQVIKTAKNMGERSDRCNPCYSSRLEQAAKMARKQWIPYFTSTLLISPKKDLEKLYKRWKEAEKIYTSTKFLRFDFRKNNGIIKASQITKKHQLYRQNYCGCGRTIPEKK